MATYHRGTDSQIIFKRVAKNKNKTKAATTTVLKGKNHNPKLVKHIIYNM